MNKKQQAQNINRNPLSIALGAYLSAERQRISPDLKSSRLAQKLEMGESLYRMIESGNARIHPKNFLRFVNAFEASRIEHGAFCRLLIAIQFLDSFLDSTPEFLKAIDQLKTNDERYSELLNSIQPLLNGVLDGQEDLKEISQSPIILNSIREFLSQPDSYGRDTAVVHKEIITGIFQEIPTIYYSFIDKTIQDLMTLPLGFKSHDLWKWEKYNLSEFTSLYAIVKDVDAIISEQNFKQYKYDYLRSPNFTTSHIIFLGNHDAKKLREDFITLLAKSLEIPSSQLDEFNKSLEKLSIHSIELSDSETDGIFTDIDPNEQNEKTNYDMAWIFELQRKFESPRKITVGLKAKIDKEKWKLKEGISLNWENTSALFKKLKDIVTNK